MRRRLWVVGLSLIVIAAACEPSPGGARALLPSIPQATIVEGKTIVDYIATLAEGKSLLAGNPILVAAIEFAQGAVNCYQDLGAVAVRVYADEVFPLSTGLVAIVDRNALSDVGNLAHCLTGGQEPGFNAQAAMQVCTNAYTLKKDDNEFYIAYLGTTDTMCQAFCSGLEGCGASKP
ncbi:MAG TPA: hypothetical protein VJG32_15860 [Anaerolineae bacterium]|nr:hypothetical protein [Anaerolineae bacterium]